jgi:hypothetical protein
MLAQSMYRNVMRGGQGKAESQTPNHCLNFLNDLLRQQIPCRMQTCHVKKPILVRFLLYPEYCIRLERGIVPESSEIDGAIGSYNHTSLPDNP